MLLIPKIPIFVQWPLNRRTIGKISPELGSGGELDPAISFMICFRARSRRSVKSPPNVRVGQPAVGLTRKLE